MTRRELLRSAGNGFGILGLASLMAEKSEAARAHFPAKAKHVIFLFLNGGPSHVDTFDPKPSLAKYNGQLMPGGDKNGEPKKLMASPFAFKKYGQSGIEVSELFPHIGSCIDDLCIIRSMVGDNINHNGACLQMNTGEQAFSRPSLGSWLLYGLGSENRDLPGFVVLSPSQSAQGAPLWSSSFLPAAYQGTLVSDLKNPVANLPASGADAARQRRQLDALRELNE